MTMADMFTMILLIIIWVMVIIDVIITPCVIHELKETAGLPLKVMWAVVVITEISLLVLAFIMTDRLTG